MLEDKETVTMTNCESVTLYFFMGFFFSKSTSKSSRSISPAISQ